MAAGVFGAPAGALVLVIVSLLTPPPGPAEQAVVDRLRTPGWS
jgi:cation/acetate symporter